MYTSTSQFPEFKGKTRRYADDCMRYVLKKEPRQVRLFLYGAATIVAAVVSVHIGAKYFPTPAILQRNVGVIETAILVVGCYGGLLLGINKYAHPAVKRYISEFDATYDNSHPPA